MGPHYLGYDSASNCTPHHTLTTQMRAKGEEQNLPSHNTILKLDLLVFDASNPMRNIYKRGSRDFTAQWPSQNRIKAAPPAASCLQELQEAPDTNTVLGEVPLPYTGAFLK